MLLGEGIEELYLVCTGDGMKLFKYTYTPEWRGGGGGGDGRYPVALCFQKIFIPTPQRLICKFCWGGGSQRPKGIKERIQ